METVNHPLYYGGSANPYEVIKIIEDWNLGFHLGNYLKYVLRHESKDYSKRFEDLSKALWYLERFEIQKMIFKTPVNPNIRLNVVLSSYNLSESLKRSIENMYYGDIKNSIVELKNYIEKNTRKY